MKHLMGLVLDALQRGAIVGMLLVIIILLAGGVSRRGWTIAILIAVGTTIGSLIWNIALDRARRPPPP